jgi:hypothetical protein
LANDLGEKNVYIVNNPSGKPDPNSIPGDGRYTKIEILAGELIMLHIK